MFCPVSFSLDIFSGKTETDICGGSRAADLSAMQVAILHGAHAFPAAKHTTHVSRIHAAQPLGDALDRQYMVRIGLATLVAGLSMGVMMITGNYMFVRDLGENGVAAFSVGCYLFPIIFSISNTVAQASQPIISYNYGAKNPVRVRQALRIALVMATVCGAPITCTMWLGAPLLVSMFLPSDVPTYQLALHGLPLVGICVIFFALNITFIGYYQSTEHNIRSTIFMLLRGIIFLAPGFMFLPDIAGVPGLWPAIPAAEALTLLVITIQYMARHLKRQ